MVNLCSAKVLPSPFLFFQAQPVNIFSDEVEPRLNRDLNVNNLRDRLILKVNPMIDLQ